MLTPPRFLRPWAAFLGLALAIGRLASAAPVSVTVEPAHTHQTLQGFGVSINAWSRAHHPLYADDAFVRFTTDELGLSVFRLQMWGGVMPKEVEDWRKISHEDFVWQGEGLRGGINRDWARRLVAANPEVKIIGSVWSAPAWMKANGSRVGTRAGFLLDPRRDYDHDNRLREDRYQHFAKWIVEWARAMEAQGTPFYGLSLQNELMFTQRFESTLYTPEQYAKIVRVTAEMFAAEGVRKPLFFGPEDMTRATYADAVRHQPYVDALMQPAVEAYFDVFATHGYSDGVQGDERENAVAYWQAIKRFGRPYWSTEGGSGDHDWPAPVTSGIAPRLHLALTQANVSLFTGWQLTSGRSKPSHHDFMEWDRPTPKTYAAMHYWRHLRPGAVRVDATVAEGAPVQASAFLDPQRKRAVTVLINPGEEPLEVMVSWTSGVTGGWKAWQTTGEKGHAELPVEVADGAARLRLPGPSITTVVADADPKRVVPLVNRRWEKEIAEIEAREQREPVPAEGILFTGSSSIRLWETLTEDLAGWPVYNRGFGGSQISDLLGYFDRVITPGKPRRVVIYSATNDLTVGKTPERVLRDFQQLAERIQETLPGTKIALVSVAPNPARWEQRHQQVQFNRRAAAWCAEQGHDFIDVWTPMLGEDGTPSREIYVGDRLHMNEAGYALWRELFRAYLLQAEGAPVAAASR